MPRALAVSALLLACLTSAGCSAGTTPQSVDRRSLVWVNALAVARPDYHVVHEEQLLSRARPEHRDAVRVVVEPRWPTWSHTEVFGRQVLELRPNEDGDVSLPDLPAWNLTEAIHALSFDAEAREQVTAEAEARLDELAQAKDLKVTIVVGFTEPLQEGEVRQLWKKIPDVGLFSPPTHGGGLPISWDYSGHCNARGFDDCNPDIRDSLTSAFRKWTGLLQTEDESTLTSFGIDPGELRNSAAAGLWYGMISTTWLEHAKTLFGDPRVNVIQVGQVAF
ncbi:hypothetical protein [Nonomuraea sp. GTA35]|uniref:hypothetical protein n=1 Tax=Nonomuraea sp. GTA35 TaxID=1676746 RepID=UPI0035C058E5